MHTRDPCSAELLNTDPDSRGHSVSPVTFQYLESLGQSFFTGVT